MIEDDENVTYQLHGFCDASNQVLSYVVHLKRMCVAFVQSKTKVVLVNQTNWDISCKELEAAEMCMKLMQDVSKLLKHV